MSEQPRPTEHEASLSFGDRAASRGREAWQAQPSLSEISHLFLTGLRQRQSEGAALPHRKPPGSPRPAVSVDLTPEEYGGVTELDDARPAANVSAVLAHHLGGGALQRVREYARHAATESGRVGLIELGDDGLRLTCFDATPLGETDLTPPLPALVEPVDGKRIRHAIEEMSWDVDRWILFLPGGAKSDPARQLLSEVGHWTLLATADDAGIVAAYRTLKALAGLSAAAISLSVLDADDAAHRTIIHRKMSGASKQFLGRAVESEEPIGPAQAVAEHIALWCRSAGAGPSAPQDHWAAVAELTSRPRLPRQENPPEQPEPEPIDEEPAPAPVSLPPRPSAVGPSTWSPPMMKITPMEPVQESPAPARALSRPGGTDVLDLPMGCDAAAILSAILKQNSQWVASPIKPPMCAAGIVAVDRDGRLHLLACGLDELRSISSGYGWLKENRSLVKMAAPQMNIDATAMPQLTLFVDQAEVDAVQLAPILQSGHVTIRTYRRLRWGEKTGLLLEAA